MLTVFPIIPNIQVDSKQILEAGAVCSGAGGLEELLPAGHYVEQDLQGRPCGMETSWSSAGRAVVRQCGVSLRRTAPMGGSSC